MEKEEKWLIPKTIEERLTETLDFLEETLFSFACFVECFERYIKEEEKADTLNKRMKDEVRIRQLAKEGAGDEREHSS